MNEGTTTNQQAGHDFMLPKSLVGRIEVARLIRELERVDVDLTAQAIRTPDDVHIPVTSQILSDVLVLNQIEIRDERQRKQLMEVLNKVKDTAPSMQITFASNPEPEITHQLVEWIRVNLHPVALVTVGLQPGLVGGCVVRTPDHIYDFSLRRQFRQNVPMLAEEIRAVITNKS